MLPNKILKSNILMIQLESIGNFNTVGRIKLNPEEPVLTNRFVICTSAEVS